VDSHISKTLAFQTRALREKEGWSQQTLAEKIDSNQNAVYRAENPNYGKQTITTLKKIAAAFDVALVVRFVPFSELADWVSGTPRIDYGLRSSAMSVPNFEEEEKNEQAFVMPEVDHIAPSYWDLGPTLEDIRLINPSSNASSSEAYRQLQGYLSPTPKSDDRRLFIWTPPIQDQPIHNQFVN